MEYIAGLRTDNYVLLASDRVIMMSRILVISQEVDKKFSLGEKLVMMCIGESGDVAQFGDYVAKNLKLYSLRNGYEISPQSALHWIRKAMANALRTKDHYAVDTVLGGFDKHSNRPYLGMVDHLASSLPDQSYLFRGFGGNFCYGILDKIYKSDMSEAEGLAALKLCLGETKKRFGGNLHSFQVIRIDKDGVHQLDDIFL